MNFTMKILAVSVLLVAMMALALATEEEDGLELIAAIQEKEIESEIKEAESIKGEEKCVVKRSACSRDWTTIGKSCFRYFATAKTWAEAQSHCRSLGGNLASVHNKGENDQFWALALKKTTWIGFSDAQQEKHWFWIDGTAFNYKNWCSGQPNNGRNSEHCAVLWKGCWHDYHCVHHRFPYICGRAPQ
ncbi:galactose-specific lectin nattectin [Larimichthys crocea]|uniref:galactose-specific lectin nattectin n=1 Tax=Larimichthys crocea TaxID=215358 RepID=UPI000F5D5618|nr:galactose-specific lectin nattectin [Larimichthys crocea]